MRGTIRDVDPKSFDRRLAANIDRITAVTFRADDDADAAYEAALYTDEALAAWHTLWTNPPSNEQVAYEGLLAEGAYVTVREAAGVFADMVAAIEMGAHDDVPW